MEQQESGDGWTTVVYKKTQVKQKKQQKAEMYENRRKERDMRYLQTHAGFQSKRLRRDDIKELVKKSQGDVFIVGGHRCVGHAIDETETQQKCLECLDVLYPPSNDNPVHCCCSSETVRTLPPNFYFGYAEPVDNYLKMMREDPL